jgi:hypothetical protein
MEQNEKKRSEQKEALPARCAGLSHAHQSSAHVCAQADGRYRRVDGRTRCGGGGEWHVMGDSFCAAARPHG